MRKLGALFLIFFILSAVSGSAEDSKKQLNHNLVQGRIDYDNGRYSKAIEWWQKALIIDPKNKEAINYIRRAQEKLKPGEKKAMPPEIEINREMAYEDILIRPSTIKELSGKYTKLGKKYYLSGKYDLAIEEWTKALEVDPANADIAEYIARTEAELKRSQQERAPGAPTVTPPPVEEKEIKRERFLPLFQKPQKDTLSLQDALELGIKNHLPLQIAREQLNLSRFKEKEAFRELFPSASIKWDESSGQIYSRDFTGRKYQLEMDQPVYRGGKLRATWEQSKVNLKISKENYEKTKEEFSIELSKAYYDLVKAAKNLQTQGKLLKDLENDLSTAKKEMDAGVSTLVEFLNVQSQYNQTYYASLSAENTFALSRSTFLQLLNLDRDPSVTVNVESEFVFKEHNVDLEKCITLAYENRADLKINELGLKAAEYGEQIAKSQQLPNVDINGNIGRGGEAYTPDKIQMSDEWFIGAKVSVPWGPNSLDYSFSNEKSPPSISSFSPTTDRTHSFGFNLLDKLNAYTEAKQGEITYEQAYADLIKGKQAAAAQVREAYFNYQEAVLKFKNSIANKELYEKELAIIKQKRLANEAQTQDIVAAKIKLAAEEVNNNSALTDSFLAVAKINKAIGIRDYFK